MTVRDRAGLVLVIVLLAAGVIPSVAAHGPEPCSGCHWIRGDGIVLQRFVAEVRVTEQIAQTSLELLFRNTDAQMREATLDIPLPPLTTLTSFALKVDGVVWDGVVTARATAREQYDDAQARGEDAALLEAADASRLLLSVNTPAGKTRTLSVDYVAHLPLDAGARVYRLDTSRLSGLSPAIETVQLDFTLHSSAGVQGLSFTGQQLPVTSQSSDHVRASRTMYQVATLDDLVAVWTEGEGAWLSGLVSSGDSGDVAFLATVSPGADGAGEALPRDLVFVLDTSGSMAGTKIVQARDSLREVLLSLRPDDRFGVVQFDTAANLLTQEMTLATGSAVSAMRTRLHNVAATGSTDFDGGLQQALMLLGDAGAGRAPVVVVVSDGLPTAGVTDPAHIVSRMEAANARGAAVHVIAIGLDADGSFLEDVAGRSGGSLTMMDPADDLQERLGGFYATLDSPLLTDIEVSVHGVDVHDVYPTHLPALYRDGTLRVLFRAVPPEEGSIRVVVKGVGVEGIERNTFLLDAEEIPVVPEVERIWGAARVEALLSDERLQGWTAERRTEIVDAAVQYGVVTKYTSWVITMPEPVVVEEPAPRASGPAASQGGASAPTSGPHAPAAPTEPTPGTPPPALPPAYDGSSPSWQGASPTTGIDDGESYEEEPTPAPGLLLVIVSLAAALVVARRRW